MPKEKIKITDDEKEAISRQMAKFFFDFWQNQKNNQIASLKSGFSSGDFPDDKVAT